MPRKPSLDTILIRDMLRKDLENGGLYRRVYYLEKIKRLFPGWDDKRIHSRFKEAREYWRLNGFNIPIRNSRWS